MSTRGRDLSERDWYLPRASRCGTLRIFWKLTDSGFNVCVKCWNVLPRVCQLFLTKFTFAWERNSFVLSLIILIRLQKLLSVQICLNMFGSKCRILQVFLQHVEDITILDHSHWALDGTRFAAPLVFLFLEKVFKWFESGEVALQNVRNEFNLHTKMQAKQIKQKLQIGLFRPFNHTGKCAQTTHLLRGEFYVIIHDNSADLFTHRTDWRCGCHNHEQNIRGTNQEIESNIKSLSPTLE